MEEIKTVHYVYTNPQYFAFAHVLRDIKEVASSTISQSVVHVHNFHVLSVLRHSHVQPLSGPKAFFSPIT